MSSNCIKPDQLPVVVLRSNDNCFLDILRCCGVENIPVIPVIYNWERTIPWLSEQSVFYKNPIEIASPDDNEQLAARQLSEIGKSLLSKYKRKILIIPSSDTTVLFLQRNFSVFNQYFIQMGPDDFQESFLNVFSKYNFYQVLNNNNIPTPFTLPVFSESQIENCVNNISYPCIYKPDSKDLTNSFPSRHNGTKAIMNHNPAELRRNLTKELSNGYKLIVQEYISIRDSGDEMSSYIYLGKEFEPKLTSAQITLKRYPDKFGTGYLGKYTNHHELNTLSAKVAKALRWRGFLSVQYKFDNRDNKWKVIEVNYRPWLSVFFQAAAGFNYIKYLYEDAYGLSITAVSDLCKVHAQDLFKVNLAVLIKSLIKESADVDDFKKRFKIWFDMHPGKYVFSTYHELDTEPAFFELRELHNKHPEYIDAIGGNINKYFIGESYTS